jgi:hypothetical protein
MSGSSLASVVGYPPAAEALVKAPPIHRLAQWHAKFWGKSMKDEEEKWRKECSPIPEVGEPRDQTQDRDECMDLDEDVDGDIISGCYALDLNVEAKAVPSIWIRADYIRIYDALQKHYNNIVNRLWTPGAVVTGQPGIGQFPL